MWGVYFSERLTYIPAERSKGVASSHTLQRGSGDAVQIRWLYDATKPTGWKMPSRRYCARLLDAMRPESVASNRLVVGLRC
jgi:hypothetical protein